MGCSSVSSWMLFRSLFSWISLGEAIESDSEFETMWFRSLFSWISLGDADVCLGLLALALFRSLFSWISLGDLAAARRPRGARRVSILVLLDQPGRCFRSQPTPRKAVVSILVLLDQPG